MASLDSLHQKIQKCQRCSLAKTRTNTVPGGPNSKAEVMFIGEAPGRDEDLSGHPFVGQAGKFLDELLATINLKREDVFIGNVLKCRPPNNRDPFEKEKEICFPYLEEQIRIIKPKLIVTLGRHAMYTFLPPELKISQVHGQPKRYKGVDGNPQVYLPLYHPAVSLYNPSSKDILIQDFQKIPRVLKKITAA